MKFRTDFVTNSSDSSFLAFNIKNKKLFDALTALGIKFENVEDGKFSDGITIILPSGRRADIVFENTFYDDDANPYEDYANGLFDTHRVLSDWLKTVFFEAGPRADSNGTNKDIYDETYKDFNVS